MIQECQDRVFSSYRNLSSSGPGLSRIAQGPLNASAPIITSSLPGGLGNPNDLPEERSENFLDNLYQRPPYQSQTLSNSVFHLHNQRQAFETRRQNEPSESGYVSDFSGLNAPRSLSTDTSTDLTTASSRSGANSQSQPTSNYVGEYSSGTQPSMSYNENDTPGTLSLDGEVVALPLSEDFSEMYMYGDHSWEVPFPQ
ncbi:hypothetical protein N431DRAFT_337578 [Stipitochalara longipes BDJ]|nr:hypothetical protein N431DRAFT_337578 [Stipitochalara longipes BDJ]